MAAINVTSGPQIQDFKVRNAVDQITTYLSQIGNLVSIQADVATQVALVGSPTTDVSLSAQGTTAIAKGVVDIVAALRAAKLMR